MALKKFTELYQLDISSDVKKKPTFFKGKDGKLQKTDPSKWLDYLEWATVLVLLYKNGAENVLFGSNKDANGYPAFYNNGKNPFVSVWVEIEDRRYDLEYPVINGNIADNDPNQMIIHKAQQRAFVKCVAINTGLGLKLWQKEESQFDTIPEPDEKPAQKKVKFQDDKFPEAVKYIKNGGSIDNIRDKYEISEDMLTKIMEAAV